MFFEVDILIVLYWLVIFYSLISFMQLTAEMLFSFLHYLEQPKDKDIISFFESKGVPKISIIYPIYNEDPETLSKVIKAAYKVKKSIPQLEIIFVDDGSQNISDLIPHYKIAHELGFIIIFQENKGKRKAQYAAYNIAKGEYILNVDSDTIINGSSVFRLLYPLAKYPKVGGATGTVRLINRYQNLLTRLSYLMYWFGGNLGRASQSYSGSMMIASGAFSMFKRKLIDKVKEEYISQFFLGKESHYADDSHLTNLTMKTGYRMLFVESAFSYTEAPAELDKFIKQQERWSKGSYRELFWIVKWAFSFGWYPFLSFIVEPFQVLMYLIIWSLSLFMLVLNQDISTILVPLVLLLVISLSRSTYGYLRTKDLGFFIFPLYSLFYAIILMPFRLKSLFTFFNEGWGTREIIKNRFSYLNVFLWPGLFWGGIASFAFFVAPFLVPNPSDLEFNKFGAISLFSDILKNTTTEIQVNTFYLNIFPQTNSPFFAFKLLLIFMINIFLLFFLNSIFRTYDIRSLRATLSKVFITISLILLNFIFFF
jgi:cellulose synthase/poly-beta-1,6-N-acetylglucosamine synthase-like glycosyltransferase